MPEHPCHDDTTTTRRPTPEPAADPNRTLCPVCWNPFTRTRRQLYCTDTCRKTAWTRRRATTHPSTETIAPQPIPQHDNTIYACATCETRYYGSQWCHDCNQPCTRLGHGGPCPHCDEPVAITDLLHTHQGL